MMLKKIAAISLIGLAAALGGGDARAHCDSEDGPVALAVRKALESGNINLVLAYAPASAEAELQSTFTDVRKVRAMGADAQKLADTACFSKQRSGCTGRAKARHSPA